MSPKKQNKIQEPNDVAEAAAPVASLTAKEKMVLEYIEQSLADSGVSPSYQEIKDHFGFASFNSVQNYLKQLSQKGYISIPNHQKRAIQVLRPSHTVQSYMKSFNKASPPRDSLLLTNSNRGELFSLPLLGRVAAGLPIEEMEFDESVDVPVSWLRNPDKSFALKVKGQSMIEDGIFDGDIILVQKQTAAKNGEIVVASVDNESTVKRIFQNKDQVELRPANASMTSMWYPPDQVAIQGIVIGLIRKF